MFEGTNLFEIIKHTYDGIKELIPIALVFIGIKFFSWLKSVLTGNNC